jgi:hypothetical protein
MISTMETQTCEFGFRVAPDAGRRGKLRGGQVTLVAPVLGLADRDARGDRGGLALHEKVDSREEASLLRDNTLSNQKRTGRRFTA